MFLAILPIAARSFAHEDRPVAGAIEGGALFAVAIFAGYALASHCWNWGARRSSESRTVQCLPPTWQDLRAGCKAC